MSPALPREELAAEVLAKHQFASIYNSRTSTAACICDADLPIPGGFDRDGYSYDPDAVEKAFCIHQAAALAAAGLLADPDALDAAEDQIERLRRENDALRWQGGDQK